MSYLVLARKKRPEYFREVVGQEHVARTLRNAIEQDRVHHAYLFCGTRGVGKTTTARILAKCLNCEEGPTAEPCNECKSCEDIKEGQSVDVYEIDGASNRGINEIRELREGVRYAPSQGDHKIYIIDEVHMLTNEAFNALLKTLEEPPDHAYFIFATTEPQKIPITILSRCQRFDFKRISQSQIVDHLSNICQEEGIEAEKAALQLIARQADGAMRDALSLLDQVIGFAGDHVEEDEVASILGVANREHLFDISRAILERDAQEALKALDVVDRYGYDMQQFASELVTHLRDLTVTAAVREPSGVTDLTESELKEAREQIELMEVSGERRRQLLHRYFSVMADGAREMTRSPYPKLIFEMTLVRLTDLEPLVGLDLLVDRLDALEGELDEVEGLPPSKELSRGRRPEQPRSVSGRQSAGAVDESQKSAGRETGATAADPESGDERSSGADEADDEDDEEGAASVPPEPREDDADGAQESTGPASSVSSEREDVSEAEEDDAVDEASATSGTSDQQEASMPEPPSRPEPPPSVPAEQMEGEDGESSGSQTQEGPLVPETDELDADAMWERVVRHLQQQGGSTGIKFEHAHPETFADGQIDIRCEPQYYSFFKREDHVEDVEQAASTLFGGAWTASIDTWDESDLSDGKKETLADQREAEYQQRWQKLHDSVRHHTVVEEAADLFEVDEEQIRVDVQLDEE